MATTRHSANGAEALLPLPEDCAVRLIDLDYGVGALITMGEDGFANIYLNARLDHAARQRALQHELRHYYREDMTSAADIREIEREMPGPVEAAARVPGFDAAGLRPIGRGLFMPEGESLARAAGDIASLRGALEDACGIYDVMQRPPLLPIAGLRGICASLLAAPEAAIAFIVARAEAGAPPALPVALQVCGPEGEIEGAIYYDANGRPHDALVVLRPERGGSAFRIVLDIRRRGSAWAMHSLYREIDGRGTERMY